VDLERKLNCNGDEVRLLPTSDTFYSVMVNKDE